VQRLERQGQLKGTFQAVQHGPSWGGISRVKVVALVNPKVEVQDGGAAYATGSGRYGYTRGQYLDRARKEWQGLERQGYTLLPSVRKRDVYEAIGAFIGATKRRTSTIILTDWLSRFRKGSADWPCGTRRKPCSIKPASD
jgi:hypothetical protein